MLWHRTDKTIIEQWQADAAYSLEAGNTPIFNLGSSNTSLDGLLGLTALQKMLNEGQNIVQPAVAIGGHSALWQFALLQTTRAQSARSSSVDGASGRGQHDYVNEPTTLLRESIRPLILPFWRRKQRQKSRLTPFHPRSVGSASGQVCAIYSRQAQNQA